MNAFYTDIKEKDVFIHYHIPAPFFFFFLFLFFKIWHVSLSVLCCIRIMYPYPCFIVCILVFIILAAITQQCVILLFIICYIRHILLKLAKLLLPSFPIREVWFSVTWIWMCESVLETYPSAWFDKRQNKGVTGRCRGNDVFSLLGMSRIIT